MAYPFFPLRPAAYNSCKLFSQLVDEGCRDKVIVWRGHDIVVDGHNRVRICREQQIPFQVKETSFSDRGEAEAWIIDNQLARRNLDAAERMYLVGRKYRNEKQRHGGQKPADGGKGTADGGRGTAGGEEARSVSEGSGTICHSAQSAKTAQRIAAEEGLSPRTVRNAEKFADAVDQAAEKRQHRLTGSGHSGHSIYPASSGRREAIF
jgi:hypothetical protein